MKMPKTIRLMGYDWKVTVDPTRGGGSFDWKDKSFVIGTKFNEQEPIILHELAEALLSEFGYRYENNQGDFTFSFNHQEFCIFIELLYQALKDNGLITKLTV